MLQLLARLVPEYRRNARGPGAAAASGANPSLVDGKMQRKASARTVRRPPAGILQNLSAIPEASE
jgi:hypothetical protein